MMRKQPAPLSSVNLSILRVIQHQPGIHFRGLGRAAQVSSAGQLRHHLDSLTRKGLLVELEDGRYKRFFGAGQHDPKLRPELARFSRVVPRRIAKLLLVGSMNRTELRRNIGCADSTLGFHLARMVQLGDLAKSRGSNCCNYALTSEDHVRQLLLLQSAGDEVAPQVLPGLQPGLQPDNVIAEPSQSSPSQAGNVPFPVATPSAIPSSWSTGPAPNTSHALKVCASVATAVDATVIDQTLIATAQAV